MVYWLHIARSNDRTTLHRERCSEVPSNFIRTDFWEGGWFDYPDKERALAAMEQTGPGGDGADGDVQSADVFDLQAVTRARRVRKA